MGLLNLAHKDKTYGSVFLEEKTVKIKKGDRKGEEVQILKGNIHIGGGKYINLSIPVKSIENGIVEFENKGEDKRGIFIDSRKWKGDAPKSRNNSSKSSW